MVDLLFYLSGLEKKDVIQSLKQEHVPVVIWGAGQVALTVKKYLSEMEVPVADVFVDDAYYTGGLFLDNMQVISKTKLLEKYQKVDVVIGYSDYQMADVLKKEKWVNEYFCFVGTAYGEFERIPFDFMKHNIKKYQTIYDMLADKKSKDIFVAFLQTKVSGNIKYTLQAFEGRKDFFDNDLYKIGNEEVYLDVGSANGENIKLFIEKSKGKYGYIYAVEPEANLRGNLVEYIKRNSINRFEIASKGAWNVKGKINFLFDGESSHVCATNDSRAKEVQVELLDNMFDYKKKVTLLKIQYRDGVVEAILGAKKILQEHKPRIAIMIGYGMENIYDVPLLIKKINPDYKLYLRFNRGATQTIVLYGLIYGKKYYGEESTFMQNERMC